LKAFKPATISQQLIKASISKCKKCSYQKEMRFAGFGIFITSMEELKIELTYNPDHFREIYYQNGQGGILTYRPTRNAITYLITFTLLTAVIFVASYEWPGISWLIMLGLLAILIAGIYAFIVISNYQKWKNNAEVYLKDLAQYKLYILHLTTNAIEIVLDTKTFIQKWDNINAAQIYDTYIKLSGSDVPDFLFPAKSMRQDEFEKLKDFIKNKIMNSVEE